MNNKDRIWINRMTKQRLYSKKPFGKTFDNVINDLLDKAESDIKKKGKSPFFPKV